jgi:DNA-binding response OmpR family regulator
MAIAAILRFMPLPIRGKSEGQPMSAQKHILIVDNDRASRSTLAAALEMDGAFAVTQADSAAEGMAKTQTRASRFDAVILDLALPDADGCELCARMRRGGLRMPIIMMTGHTSEQDVVRGLDAGANDYVTKPFRLAELAARLRAQIRAHETSDDAVLVIGPYHFHPGARTLHDPLANHRIRLTDKETAVLKFLYRTGGKPVARRTLLREVWGYAKGASTHTVETHIYRLRRKIEPEPGSVRILVNEDGGYRLAQNRPNGGLNATWHPHVRLEMVAVQ